MNVRILRGDAASVAAKYASAGDKVTRRQAQDVLRAARGKQLFGIFDNGLVVGLAAVDRSTGTVLAVTSHSGVDVTDEVARLEEHFAQEGMPTGRDYRSQPQGRRRGGRGSRGRQPRQQGPAAYGDAMYGDAAYGDMEYDDMAYDDMAYDEAADGGVPAWGGTDALNDSSFLREWDADQTGVDIASATGSFPAQGGDALSTLSGNVAITTPVSTRNRRRGSVAGAVIGLLALAFIAGGAALYLTGAWRPLAEMVGIHVPDEQEEDASPVPRTEAVTVSIPDGYGSGQIGELLLGAGVIDDIGEFHKEVLRQSAETSMKSGSYSFAPGLELSDVVALLVAGPNDLSSRITIPEGLSVSRTAELLEGQFGIPQDQFKEAAKASRFVGEYAFLGGVADDSLEGYLYPMTYDFSGQTPDSDTVIRKMLDQFSTSVDLADLDACRDAINAGYGLSLSSYDVLKVASIIEREATTDGDRPLVASVFYNRLRDGMPLQSDATMGYVVGREVTPEDLQQESPYNTYLNRGLPPTPICTPSSESLDAAKHPAQTGYYYFLIVEKDGYSNHTFSETYDQHLAAIQQVEADTAGM